MEGVVWLKVVANTLRRDKRVRNSFGTPSPFPPLLRGGCNSIEVTCEVPVDVPSGFTCLTAVLLTESACLLAVALALGREVRTDFEVVFFSDFVAHPASVEIILVLDVARDLVLFTYEVGVSVEAGGGEWCVGVARGTFGFPAVCATLGMAMDIVGVGAGMAVESGRMSIRDFDVAGSVEVGVAVVIRTVSRKIGYSISSIDNFCREFLEVQG
jgi:hypothetical protein